MNLTKVGIILLLLTNVFAYGQSQYVVNKITYDGLPEKVYVGDFTLDEIPAEYILITIDVPLGNKLLAGRIGYRYMKVDYGQPYESGKNSEFSKQLCVNKMAAAQTRILAPSIVFFNILKKNGWKFVAQVGPPENFQSIFEKIN